MKLDEIPFKWIRLLYMYPDEIEDDLLVAMSNMKHIIPYFDIPIQYGSDVILKKMNRRGSVELIKKKISRIRELFDGAILRTTLMTGFPYETDETFNDTLNLVKEIEFDSLGAFTFSKEDDTKAATFDHEVPEDIAKERYEILMTVQNEIVNKKNAMRVGKTFEVLVERYEELFDRYVGRAIFSAPDGVDGMIYIKSDRTLQIGEFYNVEIYDYEDYDLYGKIN